MSTQLTIAKTDPAEPLRICRECRRPRALNLYLLREGEGGFYGPEFAEAVCYPCRQKIVGLLSDDRRQTVAEERRQAALKEILVKIRGGGLANAPHITELSHEIFSALGGVQRVAKDIAVAYGQAMTGMSIKQKMDMFRMLVKLSEASTTHRVSAPDLSDCTDEELALVLQQQIRLAMPNQPLIGNDDPTDERAAS